MEFNSINSPCSVSVYLLNSICELFQHSQLRGILFTETPTATVYLLASISPQNSQQRVEVMPEGRSRYRTCFLSLTNGVIVLHSNSSLEQTLA